MDRPIFVMMCGLPGSGKTTYAHELAEINGAVVYSSDVIRAELFGDENNQSNNDEVFKVLHDRIKQSLRNGVSAIYDATNISSKRRRAFLMELKNISCWKHCYIAATKFKDCLEANDSRGRTVPYEVIKRMYMNWNTPYYFEGWDLIYIRYRDDYKRTDFDSALSWIDKHIRFDQHNPHHSLSLGRHCESVGDSLRDDDLTMYYAGLLHDCGKPFTKTFVNSKGETTEVAHYYQHHCTGGYDSLFFHYPEGVETLDVSILINLHMMPYNWEKDAEHGLSTMRKYERIWGTELFEKVMTLHEADKKLH